MELGGHTIDQRHERGHETPLRVDLRKNVEHGGELLGLGLGLLGISLGLVIQRDVRQQCQSQQEFTRLGFGGVGDQESRYAPIGSPLELEADTNGEVGAVGQQARADGFQGLADLQGLHGQGRRPFDERDQCRIGITRLGPIAELAEFVRKGCLTNDQDTATGFSQTGHDRDQCRPELGRRTVETPKFRGLFKQGGQAAVRWGGRRVGHGASVDAEASGDSGTDLALGVLKNGLDAQQTTGRIGDG